MASVLVLGANGLIGSAIASAFARAGYKVYGLIRNPSKAKALLNDEIEPVIGDGYKPETYEETLAKVSFVVNAMTFDLGNPIGSTTAVLDAIKEVADKINPHNGAITYIQTSGIAVYEDNADITVTEDTPQRPFEFAAILPRLEAIIHSYGKEVSNMRTIIVRPPLVYGRSGGATAAIFAGVMQGCVKYPGDLKNMFPTVHTDDLAELYVRAADRAPILNGVSFNAANRQAEAIRDIIYAAFRAAGKEANVETYEPAIGFEQTMASSHNVDCRLARSLIGWEPRKPGFVDGVSTYFSTWRAYHEEDPTRAQPYLKN